jgi:hypothetical protein
MLIRVGLFEASFVSMSEMTLLTASDMASTLGNGQMYLNSYIRREIKFLRQETQIFQKDLETLPHYIECIVKQQVDSSASTSYEQWEYSQAEKKTLTKWAESILQVCKFPP